MLDWTDAENIQLFVGIAKNGQKWQKTAETIQGRSRDDVRNHWHSRKNIVVPMEFGDLTFGRRLGEGSFGEVFHAKWKSIDVAVKIMISQGNDPGPLASFVEEVEMMRGLPRHPNICHIIGSFTHESDHFMVIEYMRKGSLADVLVTGGISNEQKKFFVMDLAKGMKHIHGSHPPLMHRG